MAVPVLLVVLHRENRVPLAGLVVLADHMLINVDDVLHGSSLYRVVEVVGHWLPRRTHELANDLALLIHKSSRHTELAQAFVRCFHQTAHS